MMNSAEDLQKKIEVDRLLSSANAFRVQGKLLAAEDACRHALALDPENLQAGEMLGDFLRENGKLEEALAQYDRLLADTAKDAAVERKYAAVTLEIAEREREKQEVADYLANPKRTIETKRSAGIATALSLVAPGFGQIYLGEVLKGSIIAGAFLLSLVVVAASPNIGAFMQQALSIVLTGRANPGNPMAAIQWPSIWLVFFIGVGLFSYIFAIVDAPISALKMEKRMKERAEAQTSDEQAAHRVTNDG